MTRHDLLVILPEFTAQEHLGSSLYCRESKNIPIFATLLHVETLVSIVEIHCRISSVGLFARAILGVALLLFYLVGHIGTVSFHHLAHAWDQHEHHTHAEETDPCHRAIYHAEADACEHPTHLGEEKEVCTYCQFVFGPPSAAEQIAEADPQLPSVLAPSTYSSIYRSVIPGIQPPRGPPSF